MLKFRFDRRIRKSVDFPESDISLVHPSRSGSFFMYGYINRHVIDIDGDVLNP